MERGAGAWLGVVLVVGFAAGGCATGGTSAQRAPEAPVPASASAGPAAAARVEALPPCPPDVVRDEAVEDDPSQPQLHARAVVPDTGLASLGFVAQPSAPPPEERFRASAALGAGAVELVGVRQGGRLSLVALRPLEQGACVVNTWATSLDPKTEYALAGTWTAPDARHLVALLRLATPAGEDGPARTAWVALTTDGRRLWNALRRDGGKQLLVPKAALVPRGKQLTLEVTVRHTQAFALGADGHFVLRAPGGGK